MLGEFINHCEDSLTASVFTHLFHLPSELWWQLLRRACYSGGLPTEAGEPSSVSFRPRWNPDGTDNNTYVEPDLFVRFADFDLIVEAKRWDHPMQNPGQWQAEARAYLNEYGGEEAAADRDVRLLALGGLLGHADQSVTALHLTCQVHMCAWNRILLECQRQKHGWEAASVLDSRTRADLRILDDLIHLLRWHGFHPLRWLHSFDLAALQLDERWRDDQAFFLRCGNLFRSR